MFVEYQAIIMCADGKLNSIQKEIIQIQKNFFYINYIQNINFFTKHSTHDKKELILHFLQYLFVHSLTVNRVSASDVISN